MKLNICDWFKASGDGWTPLLLCACLLTTLGAAIPVGYFLGVMNTLAEFIKPWCVAAFAQRYDAQLSASGVDLLWAFIVSSFLIGGICGSFGGGWCCNRYGRRGCLLISALLLLIAAVLLQFCRVANSVEMLLLGRFIAGLAAALIFTVHPMYLLELAPAAVRGSVGVFTAIGVTGGICVGQIFSLQQLFGNATLWQYALSCYALFVLVGFAPAYWLLPESPRWLYVLRHQTLAARNALQRLRGGGPKAEACVAAELQLMEDEATAAAASTTKTSFCAVVRDRELLLPLALVVSYGLTQQLTGINAIFYYSIPIYTKAGFSTTDAAWINLGAGFLNVFVTALGPGVMGRCNRRPVIMTSASGCAIALFGIAFGLFYIDFATWLPAFCMVLIAAYITFFELGMGPCPYFLGAELFEVAPRSVAMSLGSLSSWFGNFLIGMFFPLLEAAIGPFVFLPCCAMCVYCLLVTWFYLPETRGREPAELRPLMVHGFRRRVRSAKTIANSTI